MYIPLERPSDQVVDLETGGDDGLLDLSLQRVVAFFCVLPYLMIMYTGRARRLG